MRNTGGACLACVMWRYSPGDGLADVLLVRYQRGCSRTHAFQCFICMLCRAANAHLLFLRPRAARKTFGSYSALQALARLRNALTLHGMQVLNRM